MLLYRPSLTVRLLRNDSVRRQRAGQRAHIQHSFQWQRVSILDHQSSSSQVQISFPPLVSLTIDSVFKSYRWLVGTTVRL